jgi:hypothetical protein
MGAATFQSQTRVSDTGFGLGRGYETDLDTFWTRSDLASFDNRCVIIQSTAFTVVVEWWH